MRVIDFFCGGGGIGLAFKQAGFDIVYATDTNKFAVKSYNHNVENIAQVKDIKNVKADELPKSDVWAFGFPCQDLSKAGLNESNGMNGKRSGLFYEIMRLLDSIEEKPKMLFVENVTGIYKYIEELRYEFIERDYYLHFVAYNSKYWGVPQNRKRYYIIGYKGKFNFSSESKIISCDIKSILEKDVPQKYYLEKNKSDIIIQKATELYKDPQKAFLGKHGEAFCCTATYSKGTTLSRVIKSQRTHIIDDGRLRKLTPREYARLQGYPDTYEFVVSDMQCYIMIGNSVTVPVVYEIAKQIKKTLA